MKKFLQLSLVGIVFLFACCQKEQVTPVSANFAPTQEEVYTTHPLPSNVQQIGRPNWGGYYQKTQINGTITINIPDPGNWYFYQLNGRTVKFTSTQSITGHGELIITQGKDYHYGFKAWLSGQFTPAPVSKKVTYIGDSITIGYLTPSVTDSYPWLCGYDHIQIAYPGIRLIDMETQFFRDSPKGGNQIAPAPSNLYVINLGTNDAIKGVKDSDFKASYKRFIEHIRQYYSGNILLLRPFNGSKSAIIKQVADEYPNVMYIDTKGWCNSFVDGLHPDVDGNKQVAQHLKPYIDKYIK